MVMVEVHGDSDGGGCAGWVGMVVVMVVVVWIGMGWRTMMVTVVV